MSNEHAPAVRSSIEMKSVWALIITLVLAIVVVIPSASISIALAKTFVLAAGTLITLVLYILARLSRGNLIFPPFVLVSALWLPVLAYLLSALFSGVSFSTALWGVALEPDTLGFILTAAILGTLVALVFRRPEQFRALLNVLAVTFGVVVVIQALILIVGQFAPTVISPAFSMVGSFDDLATFLGLGLIGILLAFRFLELRSRARAIAIVVATIAIVLLAVANSTLVWILVALVALGLFVEAVMMRRKGVVEMDVEEVHISNDMSSDMENGTHSLVLPLIVLAISLFFLIGSTLGGALASGLHVNVLNVRPSWQSTLSVAHGVYSTSPIFGSGPSTFGTQWLKYRDPALNSTVFWDFDFSSAIGFIPTSFVTTGLLGALAWIGLFGLFVVFGLRMLILRTPPESYTRYVAIYSFVATLYLFAVAIFDVPGALILMLAFVFAGLFASTMRFAMHGGQRGIVFSRSPRIGFIVVFGLTLILLLAVVAAYSLVEHSVAAVELTRASNALNDNNLVVAQEAAQEANSFVPSVTSYQIQAEIANASLNSIEGSTSLSQSAAQQQFQSTISTGINAALTATRLAPSNYQSWIELGNLYAQAVPLDVAGSYASAKDAYDKAEALDPTNAQIPFTLAQLDIANKDIPSAIADLKAAIALKQNYTDAIFLLSQLEVQTGDLNDALAAALAAEYFTPNDPNILFQVGVLYAVQGNLPNAQSALAAAVAANPQFANARYFLAAVYAKEGNLSDALAQLQAIAALSSTDSTDVASQISALQAGKNPFPANLLTAASSTPSS